MKRIAPLMIALWALASPLKADVVGPQAPPPAPAAPGAAQGVNPDDLAARMALDREESRSLTPAPARTGAASAAPAPAVGLGALLGMGMSAALLALGLVLGWSQRRLILGILDPRRIAAARAAALPGAPVPAAREPRAAAQPRAARAAASMPPAPADAEALRQLAAELRRMMSELKAERARWEREWEEREMQWFRRRQREAGAAPVLGAVREDAPGPPHHAGDPAASAVVSELEQAFLPRLGGTDPAESSPGMLSRVEQMLQQGLSAEEVSRQLRVGLREIQWMMRMGALESR